MITGNRRERRCVDKRSAQHDNDYDDNAAQRPSELNERNFWTDCGAAHKQATPLRLCVRWLLSVAVWMVYDGKTRFRLFKPACMRVHECWRRYGCSSNSSSSSLPTVLLCRSGKGTNVSASAKVSCKWNERLVAELYITAGLTIYYSCVSTSMQSKWVRKQ